jgi:hypothetical protein
VGPKFTCDTCHLSTDPNVVATIASRADACTGCHVDVPAFHNYGGVGQNHALPDLYCVTTPGCHGTGAANIAAIHGAKLLPGIGHAAPGCAACHAPGVTPTNNCAAIACHGAQGPHGEHAVITSSGTPACTQSACHGTATLTIHASCAVCHDPSSSSSIPTATITAVIAAGEAGTPAHCESCHTSVAVAHVAIAGAHTVSGSCFVSTCHGTDVTRMHTNDFRGTGATPPGCAACHGPGKTPSTNCTSCHADIVTPHDYATAHAGVTTMLDTNSSTCVACHGDNLTTVASGAGSPVVYSVPPVAGQVTEHKGCSCHAYFEAGQNEGNLPAGQVGCQNCHATAHYSAHGWGKGFTVSGHNTTTFGTVGARTDFSSLGITDTVGAAPSAQFPLTVNNTFKAGYSWTSTVSCEDCHTGLVPGEVAGPHGGQTFANWGIDPAYSGSFETASLWGGTYAQKVSGGTTVTIGPFAEGIAQWAPAGTTEEQKQELVNYQVVTPDMSNATTTALVPGPATVTAGNVICVKCHDLYDATKTTGFKGWANYAHEHHSADTGSFKMNFGKYQVGDGGTMTTVTVTAETTTAAVASVPGATKYKEIVAASLGREDAGACRNCHIAIPHGWKRPKLIVYSNLNPNDARRTALGLPATGDTAPYNIGPAVWEGDNLFATTGVGSGQMNGLASGPVHFREATHLLPAFGSLVATIGSNPAQLLIEDYNYPSLYENENPANGSEFVNWSASQCNACAHHATTSFANPAATQPDMTWNSRESNWTSTKPANGAWK